MEPWVGDEKTNIPTLTFTKKVLGRGTYLAMDQEGFDLAVHRMLLYFGDVVGNVVDEVHVQVVRRGVELLGKSLATEECHGGPVDPGKVGRGGHGFQVVLSFL